MLKEQGYDPYSFWHHQQHFTEVDGGVEITDIVHYKIPFWFIGDIANSLIVKNQLPIWGSNKLVPSPSERGWGEALPPKHLIQFIFFKFKKNRFAIRSSI